jgi:H+-translocating NAD(P) transhydrogenase subunit alpha
MPVLFCPRETFPGETRVALTPDTASRLTKSGVECVVETSAGAAAGFQDSDYQTAGAKITESAPAAIPSADIIVSVRTLPDPLLGLLKPGTLVIGFLDPFKETSTVARLAAAGVAATSLEFIPRTTIAQKMDALSSQASLAGYASVLLAAMRLDKILPMMMTPAGTLQPSRFLIVGVGVAGLQAIATAKRLGARVTAFDTRPVVEEQVRSLGAKFLKIDLGETGQTDQGYAKELTAQQIELQRQGMAKACAESDAVITTAQVFGGPAPRIITAAMLDGMRPGSVVVDLAVATGGNVEGSQPGREVVRNGIRILGADNLPCSVARDASTVLANNIAHFITHVLDGDARIALDPEDEIVKSAVIARDGRIVNERVQSLLAQATPTS